MATMSIRDLRKSFGATEILRGVSLDVRDEEFVALVGPSGCGKSTLMRLIAGLEAATSGDIVIADRTVTNLPPKQRDVAMVFQNYALYPHLTVRANMGFSLKLRGTDKSEITQKVEEAALILGLETLLDRYPGQLSGGQRQRVATGRAIVRDPALFLFDEPLSNLDAKLRVQMRTEIKALHQRLRSTIIYVTHDQIEAMTMADRIVVMQSGEIEQEGAPLDLYDRPANAFVAGFLGSPAMNFIDGRIDAGAVVAADGTRLPISSEVTIEDGRLVTWGLRPEHVDLDPIGIAATVEVVEPTGPDTQLLLRLAGKPLVALLRKRVHIRPGQSLNIRIDPSHVHLFDSETGMRID
ncbi:sn-glycerol-3-phosphate ABC transporter ATP-binding protein UgpC [Mesorhizobium sp. DCY119]|uniref:ABC transporter ATP-binding protein n=1 Tax=Mesorhizobium sp. DCY119 TaxID=2108445 RepID=UPI000E7289B5|nr:sn-glycerol-3-phosphate ABC transporter ATP-binding protein UgpC [Mesorhizobium sp. DCY119]RJG40349.1 sn-glycerol-3-phosphate ABC transporter ATP-binding protein UgpC [Mesorhizobium sp. DCY119]